MDTYDGTDLQNVTVHHNCNYSDIDFGTDDDIIDGIISSFVLTSTGTCAVNSSGTITGTLKLSDSAEASSDILSGQVSAIQWTSSDQNIVRSNEISCVGVNSTDNRTAELMVSFTPHAEGTVTITGTASNGSAKSCQVTVTEEEAEDPYITERHVTGKLTSVNLNTWTITIGNTEYAVRENFSMNTAQENLDKTVVARLLDDKVAQVDSIDDIIEPKIRMTPSEPSLVYQNGAFGNPSFTLSVELYCGAKRPYWDNDIKGTEAENASVQISGYELSAPEGSLRFKNGKASISSSKSSRLKVGESIKEEVPISVKDGYTPNRINNVLTIGGTVTADSASSSGSCKISVCNLDLQQDTPELSENGKKKKEEANDARDKLSKLKNTVISIDTSALNEYFSNSEIERIESSVNAWISSIFVAVSLANNKNFLERLQERFGLTRSGITEKIFNKALKELGVSMKMTTTTINISQIDTAYTDVFAISNKGSEKGKALQVHFSLNMDFYAVDSGENFGGKGILSYYIVDSKGNKHEPISSISLEGFGGTVYYSNFGALAASMKEIALSSIQDVYNEVWGNDIDDMVSSIREEVNKRATNRFVKALTSSTLEEVLKEGKITFSNGIFKISQKLIEKSYKKLSCHCPVDVYVYNDSGALCGSIVNNEIVSDTNAISMYLKGDEKYLYLMNEDYTMKYVGNGTGTMDMEIEEYADGEKVRTITYTDIALKENTVYYSRIPELTYVDNILMNPIAAAGGIIYPRSDSWQDVQPSQVFAAGITLDHASLALSEGDTIALSATITPANASNQNVLWSSTNASAATVTNKGVVTAVKAGTSEIKAVTEDGGYEAVCTVTVKENPLESNPDLSKIAKVALSKNSYTYNGKQRKPDVSVTVGTVKLVKGKDYKVSYKNNKKIGTASVVISGIGSYTGKVTKKFQILPKGTSLSRTTAKSKGFSVSWKRQKDSTDGYQLQYSTSKKFTKKTTVTKTIKKPSTTKQTVKKCKAKKSYYVRIRTYKTVKGKKYYSAWSKVKRVKTKK